MKFKIPWLCVFTCIMMICLPGKAQLFPKAGISIKADVVWPVYASTVKGLTSVHLESEITNPSRNFGASLMVQYLSYQGMAEVDIWVGNPPECVVERKEIAVGIGGRLYPFSFFGGKASQYLGFFAEPQAHLQFLNDTISNVLLDYYERNIAVHFKASFKAGYQLILGRRLLLEPAMVIRYYPDHRYSMQTDLTFNFLVGYKFR